MAGAEYDSYLVADPKDPLSEKGNAKIGLKQYAIECSQTDVKGMTAKLYVVHTYNCPLIS